MLGSALYLEKRDLGEVEAAFDKAVSLNQQNFMARTHLIQAHAARGDIDQAIASVKSRSMTIRASRIFSY